jgi:hypothetical protein
LLLFRCKIIAEIPQYDTSRHCGEYERVRRREERGERGKLDIVRGCKKERERGRDKCIRR